MNQEVIQHRALFRIWKELEAIDDSQKRPEGLYWYGNDSEKEDGVGIFFSCKGEEFEYEVCLQEGEFVTAKRNHTEIGLEVFIEAFAAQYKRFANKYARYFAEEWEKGEQEPQEQAASIQEQDSNFIVKGKSIRVKIADQEVLIRIRDKKDGTRIIQSTMITDLSLDEIIEGTKLLWQIIESNKPKSLAGNAETSN